MEPYSHDEVLEIRAEPEAVVKARSAEDVSEVLQLAQAERFPVTPRGVTDIPRRYITHDARGS